MKTRLNRIVGATLESDRHLVEMRRRFPCSSSPAPLKVRFGIEMEPAAAVWAFVQSSTELKVVRMGQDQSTSLTAWRRHTRNARCVLSADLTDAFRKPPPSEQRRFLSPNYPAVASVEPALFTRVKRERHINQPRPAVEVSHARR